MTRQNKTMVACVAAALLLSAGAGGYLYMQTRAGEDAFAACAAGQVGGGAIGGPFTLTDGDGRTVTDTQVITKPSLIYFGYTFCPDICPLDNARNAEAVDLLAKRGYDVTPIFISIDPKRDTPEVVKEYAANFSPKMIGLTGTPAEVKAASRAYRTYYRVQNPDQKYYLVDHSTYTYLVFPHRGFVDFFKRGDTAEQIADRTACFIKAAEAN